MSVRFGETLVLDQISLSAGNGMLGIVGPNGSGKSTLLRTLYAGLSPGGGVVELDDRPVSEISRRELAREISVVVQEHPTDLTLRVSELVMLGRLPHQRFGARETDADRDAVAAALSEVGALDLIGRVFCELSGGEKQRVLVARGLAQGADHLLLDEPTNHLDIRYQHDLLDLLSGLPASVTVVLHDLNLAAQYCDAVLLIDAGRVTAEGTPKEVFTPEILEPVYGIGVDRIMVDDRITLAFHRK